MLRRVHQRQKLAKIQEMDHQALRVLSQTPGRTPAEKAGPRQELVAVVKEDTSDLPENAVLIWSARRLKQMAHAYCRRNENWRGQERFSAVQRLGRLLDGILYHPNLQEVGVLHHHLITPTYCFQFEHRYRHIWNAYVRIRRQDQAIDDVWRWQGHLWGTTARLILSSLFLDANGWEEVRPSTPYFRLEGACGDWTAGPSVPGPYSSSIGKCEIVDLRDEMCRAQVARLGLPEDVLKSGADWILCWPSKQALCLMWAVLSGTSKVKSPDNPPDLDVLRKRMGSLSATTDWTWTGWILQAFPEHLPDEVEWIVAQSPVYVLQLPAALHLHWGDLIAGLNMTLEELDED